MGIVTDQNDANTRLMTDVNGAARHATMIDTFVLAAEL
jgi:hypothetical protein